MAQYGSYENYQKKRALIRGDVPATRAFHACVTTTASFGELREALGAGAPYWMCPVELASIDLALIGSPEHSKEWHADIAERTQRAKQPIGVYYEDYTNVGWPRSAGSPVRLVTRWEHRAIMRQLRTAGLTKPGAEVPTVGKTLAEMIEQRSPTPPWLIDDILREGGAAMIYGPSGIGKTWLTHTLMILAAAGKGVGVKNGLTDEWLLQAGPHEGAKVLLIDGEMLESDITERPAAVAEALKLRTIVNTQGAEHIDYRQLYLAMLQKGDMTESVAEGIIAELKGRDSSSDTIEEEAHEAAEDDRSIVDLSNILVYPKTAQDHRAEFIDLADEGWKSQIVGFCKTSGIKVVIFDNLSTLNDTLEDENDAANWNVLSNLIVALKKESVATLLVHHANKGNTGFRGSTNIATTLETIVKLERVDTDGAKDGAAFKVKIEKNRAKRMPKLDGKTLKLMDGRWEVHVDPMDLATEVVRLVQSLRYKTQLEVGKALGVDQYSVSRSIKAAVARGLVKKGELQATLAEARKLATDMDAPEVDDEDFEDAVSALDL
ncbi:MAG: AAA family ATPase [Pseudomonadota bacterium]